MIEPQRAQIFHEGITDIARNKLDMRCNGSFLDIHENDLFKTIEKVSENDLENNLISRHGKNKQGGILHVQGMEQQIEMEGVKKSLGKIEKKIEVLTDLLRLICLNLLCLTYKILHALFFSMMNIFGRMSRRGGRGSSSLELHFKTMEWPEGPAKLFSTRATDVGYFKI